MWNLRDHARPIQKKKLKDGKNANQQNIFNEISQCAQAICNMLVFHRGISKVWASSFRQACELW